MLSGVGSWLINQSSPNMETIDSAKMRAWSLSAGAAYEWKIQQLI